MTTSPRFEDRLLEQLRQVVADRPTPAAAPHPRPRTTRVALAGVGVAAAATLVAVVATSNDPAHSAYAVQPQAGGAVTVTIHSLSDADGLQRSLRAAGVPAVVDYVPAGDSECAGSGPPASSPGTRVAPGSGEQGPTFRTGTGVAGPGLSQHGKPPAGAARHATTMSVAGTSGGDATFTIDPGTLEPGDKVYITTSSGSVSSIAMAIGPHRPAVLCAPAAPAP